MLARDRELRTREARTSLGDRARIEPVAEVFVLIGAPDHAAFPTALELARKAADAYFNGRIKTRPSRAIPLYVFGTTKAYHAFCLATEGSPCVSELGFYDPQLRRVLVNAQNGLGSLTHEMMHPLIEADFPQCPDWFNEGVASLFGKAVFPRPGEVHGAKNWRLPELKKALASPRRAHAGMDQLFGMNDWQFRDADQGLHYAMARYLCQWLDEHGQLWPFFQKWREQIATDATGVRSFTAITGKTPAAANVEWVKWVQAL